MRCSVLNSTSATKIFGIRVHRRGQGEPRVAHSCPLDQRDRKQSGGGGRELASDPHNIARFALCAVMTYDGLTGAVDSGSLRGSRNFLERTGDAAIGPVAPLAGRGRDRPERGWSRGRLTRGLVAWALRLPLQRPCRGQMICNQSTLSGRP
jgi:hypothetical protein